MEPSSQFFQPAWVSNIVFHLELSYDKEARRYVREVLDNRVLEFPDNFSVRSIGFKINKKYHTCKFTIYGSEKRL
jgi:hypothetical protein